MFELRPLPYAEKLNLMKACRVLGLTPTAAAVLQFLIDDQQSAYWSTARLGAAVGRATRTIDQALATLRQRGFITIVYRRRGTAVKVLDVGVIRAAIAGAVTHARKTCAASMSLFRRGFQASHKTATYILSHLRKKGDGAEWREARPASASLLRSKIVTQGPS